MAVQSLQAISIKVNYESSEISCYPLLDAKMLLDPKNNGEASELYKYQYRNLVATPLNESSLLTFGPQFNPFGSEIIEFVAQIRTAIAAVNAESKGKCKFFFYSAPATEVDAKAFTMDRLFPVLGLSLMLIFALVALHFRAAIVPFKLFLTIVLPILFVYGLAVLVFQRCA